ncbi:9-hexadecenoic acid cis-trans isomerase [Psychromonas sp. psych-6C06]|uniref:fatty acid cis/trans isomerase n=1 Tax=Psychromonas sp. psych-6C06 TaxID=2058089 RepID=UPI000C3262EF|nr:fatty acid cis/trans isomerase [Psychromonas sp. psych-6C06]PKF62462.1 9-hexadecenoic acid cis-trans isomerase [Psychromonas sp. psych-6C06]
MNYRLLLLSFFAMLLFACSDKNQQATIEHGSLQVRDRIVDHADPLAKQYHEEVKPVLENRCVVCHACYDAPCQLKLSSPEGIDRGFSPELVYGTRFKETDPMRLFIDAQTTQQWREKGYKGVLNERDQSPQANLEQSVLYHLLELKKNNPLPQTETLSGKDFDFALNREQTCPDMSNIDDYKQQQPLAGMPYGLPGLDNNEFNTLKSWLEKGSPMAQPLPLSASVEQRIIEWENIFNQQDKKSKLINRYLYEHLFLGHLYFSEEPFSDSQGPVFFNLVRSSTPPGEAIQVIPSRRPYDDPEVQTFYYRLRQYTGTIVNKTHMPYALNAQRLQRWNELFYDAPFSVDTLPGYQNGSNPFKNFVSLPTASRHQFLLDEAQYTIMGFIKGPVCRGQTALDVIQDKFWVFFTSPETLHSKKYSQFIFEQADNLELPSDYSATNFAITSWYKYAKREKAFINAEKQVLGQVKGKNLQQYIGIDKLWSGSDNASLTIFRHFDSAEVVKGLQGEAPKNAWVINYPSLERIHYLLVAGYDVFGSIKHQLITRLYMDFLRIESEMAFLILLPAEDRKAELDYWYTDATSDLKTFIHDNDIIFSQKNNIVYQSKDAKKALFSMLKEQYKTAKQYNLDVYDEPLASLNRLPSPAIQQLPQVSMIMVQNQQGEHSVYSLLRHNERTNVSTLLKEHKTRLPEQDKAEIFKGVLSSYPQVIFSIEETQLDTFISQLQQVENNSQYQQFLTGFAIRRTDPDFWKVSDQLHQTFQQKNPIEYGLFDYNRLENR